ncbi:hypothetical protein BO71DRAFT_251620 [Aspergillus ellipticus CBS 707.79]|uniref:Uncharacterized protein n=1 Tax=Aspergillus ellipticus CBS 707.79 TaxID=1448320 RepID=A0A319D8N2_9EURO|nr:hypothetical protein BO71DRAFT_251620 [Aspergillus ellipticus CBS 707.79]
MIRYKPTRVSLGEEDLRYHLERLLQRHSQVAEWHQQELDRTGDDDEAAFLDSDILSSSSPLTSPSSSESLFCESDEIFFSDLGSEPVGYDRDSRSAAPSPREPDSSPSTTVHVQPPELGNSCASGSGAPASSPGSNTRANSDPPQPASPGARRVRGLAPRHSLPGQSSHPANISADLPLRLVLSRTRGSWGVSLHPSFSHPRLLHAPQSRQGTVLSNSAVVISPQLLTDTPLKQYRQRQTGGFKHSADLS